MPTYAYVCTACDHSFEAVQAITDDSLTECPSCGGVLRKKFHAVGVSFKGSGFYRNDSRAGSSGSAGGSAKESDGGSGTSGAKDSGSKDSGSKDSGSKDSGSKESGGGGASKSSSDSSSSSSGSSTSSGTGSSKSSTS